MKRSVRFDPAKLKFAFDDALHPSINATGDSLRSQFNATELQQYDKDSYEYFQHKKTADAQAREKKMRAAMTTMVDSSDYYYYGKMISNTPMRDSWSDKSERVAYSFTFV